MITPPFSLLLAAVDDTPAAREAARHAYGLAIFLGARLDLVHIGSRHSRGLQIDAEALSSLQDFDALLEPWLVENAEPPAIQGISSFVVDEGGKAGPVLVRLARERDADLVIAGRDTDETFERFVLGSTTRHLLQHLHTPILVIPWARDGSVVLDSSPGRYRRIVLTTDFSEDSDAGLLAMAGIARSLESRLILVHVEASRTRAHATLSKRASDDETTPEAKLVSKATESEIALLERKMRVNLEDLETHAVIDENTVKGVLEVASDRRAELVAVPSHGKGRLKTFFLGSTSRALMERCPLPLLVLSRAALNTSTKC